MSLKAQRTKADLLDAARTVLLNEGIERLSMDRVALAAGVSKGAIMYHFPTKRALQAALIENYAEHLDRELRRHEACFEGLPEETFIPGFIAWFRSFDSNNFGWASIGVQLLSQQANDPELLKPVRDWYERLFARVLKLPKRTRTKMLLVVMALEGLFYTHKFGLDLIPEERKAELYELMEDLVGTTGTVRRKNEAQNEIP